MSLEPPHKRRRLNNSIQMLTKPFVSPLKTSRTHRQPLKQNDAAGNTCISYKPSMLAHTTRVTPIDGGLPAADENVHRTVAKSTSIRADTCNKSAAHDAASAELAIRKALTSLELQIRTIRNEIDVLSQAARLSSSATDATLLVLAHRWKCASQAAAEQVFDTARERVSQMGGVVAWRRYEVQRRRYGNDWVDEVADTKQNNADCEFDSEGEELPEEEKERRMEEKRAMTERMRHDDELQRDDRNVDTGEQDRPGQSDEENASFTMEMMLRSLNIELDIIGYDSSTETWISE